MGGGYLDGVVLIVLAAVALPVLGLITLGLALMFADRKRRPPHATCGACAYILTGSLGATTACPECGSPFGSSITAPKNWQQSCISAPKHWAGTFTRNCCR